MSDTHDKINFRLTAESGNAKTGPIPVVSRGSNSCPTTCPFMNSGCYGENSWLAKDWRLLTEGVRGYKAAELFDKIKDLRPNLVKNPRRLARINVVGDLATLANGTIDVRFEARLWKAFISQGFRPFGYSHHTDLDGIVRLNKALGGAGIVNASCESGEQADRAIALGIPATIVVSEPVPPNATTPAGHPIRNCPAAVDLVASCADCGVCARERLTVVAFPVHGARAVVARSRLGNIR
jgi:hypothetical protein